MRTEQLYYFLETARCGSFSKAAENLYMKQPSLKESINNLEAELGGKLFTTSSRGVQLTRYGHQCLPLFQRIIQTYENAKLSGNDQSHDLLQFGIDFYVDNLQRKIPYSNKDIPSVIQVQNYSVYQDYIVILNHLLKGSLDVGCFIAPRNLPDLSPNLSAQIKHNLVGESIFVLPITCNIPSTHPLFSKKALTITDFIPYNLYTASHLQFPFYRYGQSIGSKLKVYAMDSKYRYNQIMATNGIDIEDHILQYETDFHSNPNMCYKDISALFPFEYYVFYPKNTPYNKIISHYIHIHHNYYEFKKSLQK